MARSGRGTAFARGKTVLDWAKASLWGPVQSNPRGEVCVAQGLPPESELVRLGNSWTYATVSATNTISSSTPNFLNTVCNFWLWNRDPLKTYLISSIDIEVPNSGGIGTEVWTPMAHLIPYWNPAVTIPTTSPSGTILSLAGKSSYGGCAIIRDVVNTTSDINDNGGHYIGRSFVASSSTSNTLSIHIPCYGRYVVPPGAIFLAGLVSSGNGGIVAMHPIWHEVQLPVSR